MVGLESRLAQLEARMLPRLAEGPYTAKPYPSEDWFRQFRAYFAELWGCRDYLQFTGPAGVLDLEERMSDARYSSFHGG